MEDIIFERGNGTTFQEIEGDIIQFAKDGNCDVVVHGCNCFCTMGAGLAPQMANAFGCDKFELEGIDHSGDETKLGKIDWQVVNENGLIAVNAYTQYRIGYKAVSYQGIEMCMRAINKEFKGKKVALPLIGCGLAGGDWNIVKRIIETELTEVSTVIVHYKK
jgi:O-acetyl-ADP-ribose deacetylase (regulator of RNase III)